MLDNLPWLILGVGALVLVFVGTFSKTKICVCGHAEASHLADPSKPVDAGGAKLVCFGGGFLCRCKGFEKA